MQKPTNSLQFLVKSCLLKMSEIVNVYIENFNNLTRDNITQHTLLQVVKESGIEKFKELEKLKCESDVLAVLLKPRKENEKISDCVLMVYDDFLKIYELMHSQKLSVENFLIELDIVKQKINNAMFTLESININ